MREYEYYITRTNEAVDDPVQAVKDGRIIPGDMLRVREKQHQGTTDFMSRRESIADWWDHER